MNPLQSIPPKFRLGLYAGYALGGPVLIYTAARGWTGEGEYALYVGLGTALGLTAAANVNTYDARHDKPAQRGYGSGVI